MAAVDFRLKLLPVRNCGGKETKPGFASHLTQLTAMRKMLSECTEFHPSALWFLMGKKHKNQTNLKDTLSSKIDTYTIPSNDVIIRSTTST